MRLLTRVTLAVAVLPLAACTQADPLDHASTCPGSTCTSRLRALSDRIASLDGVDDVVEVHREHVVGKPERVTVRVAASPSDTAAGKSLAGSVADAVERSDLAPEQLAVTVVWRPQEMVEDTVDWTSHQPPPDGSCADRACTAEIARLEDTLAQRYAALSGTDVALDGSTVRVTGRWGADGDVPAVQVAELVHASALRGYDTIVVRLTHEVPREVEVRRGGW